MIRSLSQISGWGLGSSEVSGGGFLAYRRISQYLRHFCFASSECLARGGGGEIPSAGIMALRNRITILMR